MRTRIQGAHVYLPDGIRVCDVLVEGSCIAAVDPAEDMTYDRLIPGSGKLLMPGFVNAHTHAYMTLLRGRGDDLPFMEWLFGRIQPMEDKLTSEDAYWGTSLALCEMIRSGTTCYN